MDYYITGIGTLLAIMTLLGVSFNLLMGYSGLFSIAHGAYFGLGAYVAGILMRDFHWEFLGALLAAFLICAILSLLLGLAAGRVADIQFVILTLAVQVGLVELFNNLPMTGGPGGLPGIPQASVFGVVLDKWLLLASAWLVLGVVAVLLFQLLRSPFGRAMRSSRDDALAARSIGKETRWIKIRAFILSSGIAGIAGGFMAVAFRYITPTDFTMDRSIQVLSIAILGGLGTFFGPYVGAAIVVLVPQALTFLEVPSSITGPLNILIFSVMVLLFLRFRPQGILGSRSARRPPPARDRTNENARFAENPSGSKVGSPLEGEILSAKDVSISFGGLRAVRNVSLEIYPGEITGLVGPNGAGKTTLFNILSGLLSPDEGQVFYGDREITRLSLERLARSGLVRSFQDVRLFQNMTCRDNVLVAMTPPRLERVLPYWSPKRDGHRESDRAARADDLLAYLGLASQADAIAGELSYAEQKLLMIGRLLATDASCYLFDEPMSGLDADGRARVLELLRRTAERGATVCLIEHSLDVMKQVCSRIAFLAEGELVRVGPTEEIIGDTELSRIYFGSDHA